MAKECIRSADGMQHRNYIVGNLIEYSRNEAAHPYRLTFNQKLGNLYSAGWTPIDWTERRKLGKKPLALWLHGYIASYATIYPTKVETYQKLCGSRNADIHAFRQKLKEALGTLLAEGFIKGFFSITALWLLTKSRQKVRRNIWLGRNVRRRSSRNIISQ